MSLSTGKQLFFLCFASSNLFSSRRILNFFKYFQIQLFLSQVFFYNVNFRLLLHTVYRSGRIFNNNSGTHQKTCSLEVLLVPERCFWSAKTRKKRSFGVAYKSCTRFSNVAQTYMKKIGYTSLFLQGVAKFRCMVIYHWFFFICGSGFWLNFCRIAVLLNYLHLGSKPDFTTIGPILVFLYWNVLSFAVVISAWTSICRESSFLFLWKTRVLFDD